MAAEPLVAALPPDLTLYAGCVVRLVAIDPTTGATVAGVNVGNVSLFVRNVGGGALDELDFGPFRLVVGPEG